MKQKTHADTVQSNRRNSLSKKKFSSRFKSVEKVFSLPHDDIKETERERDGRGKVDPYLSFKARARVFKERENGRERERDNYYKSVVLRLKESERRTNAKKGGGWREKTKKKERESS